MDGCLGLDGCLCGYGCADPIEVGDDMDRIIVVRAPRNLTATQFATVRSTVVSQLREAGRDYPVIVLEPGFDIETVLI